MNNLSNIIAISFVIFIAFGCKKDKFEHKPINFSYADDIAGTYVGLRTKHPLYWGGNPATFQPVDTITVIVEDRRTDKVCNFYISYFNKEFMIKPDKYFINISVSSGTGSGTTSSRNTYVGYFEDDILHYSHLFENIHYTGSYYPTFMKLYKQ